MRITDYFDKQEQLFNEQDQILYEIEFNCGGEITEEQENRLKEIETELDSTSRELAGKIDIVGFWLMKMKDEVELQKKWQDNFYTNRKIKERKLESYKQWVARSIRNIAGEGEKLKGDLITIKDISRENVREVFDKKLIPEEYHDATFRIPLAKFDSLPLNIVGILEEYRGGNEPNEKRAKGAKEVVAGVKEIPIKYNFQAWGLNKFKNVEE